MFGISGHVFFAEIIIYAEQEDFMTTLGCNVHTTKTIAAAFHQSKFMETVHVNVMKHAAVVSTKPTVKQQKTQANLLKSI